AVRSREGLGQAISGALTGMPSSGAKVTSVVCDLNGESYRGEEYLFASSRRADQFVDPADIRAPAENWGDVGAASLPLFMALAKHAVDKGYAQGPHALLCSGSESGLRGCSLLEINSPPIVAQN
ncbi:MAG: 3-oxoacyl-[acyl-carrier-protein] synthase-1, partial [Pirellulaceae bacterium]